MLSLKLTASQDGAELWRTNSSEICPSEAAAPIQSVQEQSF